MKGPNMAATFSDPEQDEAVRIVALFSVLIHSWRTNDFAEAANARAELERLGVCVRITRRRIVSGARDSGAGTVGEHPAVRMSGRRKVSD
jgi:hypothetical protein